MTVIEYEKAITNQLGPLSFFINDRGQSRPG